MLYDKSINAFLKTCEYGSFTRAAEDLYISHTALIKQINHLEEEIGVKLFIRSSHGVTLTEAGKVFNERCTELVSLCDDIVQKARNAGEKVTIRIRVGVSLFYPPAVLLDLWHSSRELSAKFELIMVQIKDDARRYAGLGSQYDILVGPYDLKSQYPFYPIGSYPFTIAMPYEHPLSDKKKLHFSDLDGQTIMIMKEGTSVVNDAIRKAILAECRNVTIVDIEPHYDMQTFNQCAEHHCLLLSLSCWDHVHPGLISIPLDEPYVLPGGIVTAEHVSEGMETFIQYLKNVLKE